MSGELEFIRLTDENFAKEVLEHPGPVLVEFTKKAYGGHYIVATTMQEILRNYHNKIKIARLDVDLAVETAKHFRIREIPTVLFFRDGVVVAYLIGIFRKKDIMAKLQAVVGHKQNNAGEAADQP
ncbi:MAG TPA: thioredoxin domain-containing protein [Nitrospiria bacterium]|nr:thioredoxin domain-containing protein [Nitrospiria bacterium]